MASPVYRASFTGLFKHLFDFVGQYALFDKPGLLAATGGTDRHALIIEHQFRPLFAFFQALTLPIGVYAKDSDFTTTGPRPSTERIDPPSPGACRSSGSASPKTTRRYVNWVDDAVTA